RVLVGDSGLAPSGRGARRRSMVEAARMKGVRTPVALFAVALVLGGYIFLVERHGSSTGDAALSARRVVPRFERDKVSRIEIGGTVVEKKGDDWRITKPIDFAADRAAIDDVLSGVEFLESKRVIEGKPQPAEYGFDKPRVTVRIGDVQLVVGSKEDAT